MRNLRDKTLVNNIIVAHCADYQRKKRAIMTRSCSRRVLMEYKYTNSRLFDAATEFIGSTYAEDLIFEIGNYVGFANTKIKCISESCYKRYKEEVKEVMAKKLYLID